MQREIKIIYLFFKVSSFPSLKIFKFPNFRTKIIIGRLMQAANDKLGRELATCDKGRVWGEINGLVYIEINLAWRAHILKQKSIREGRVYK